MKRFLILSVMGLGLWMATAVVTMPESGPPDRPEIKAVEDFFEPLSQHGVWLHLGEMGWCWQPSSVADDWRPYTVGHWTQTDDGPYWVSDEPWAWACYHYGRWFKDLTHGWLWKPGTEWAPAWVTFRENEDVIGWAPIPPLEEIYVEEVYIPATTYVFVDAWDFWSPWGFSFYYSYHHHRCRYHTHCNVYTCSAPTTQLTHHRHHHTSGDHARDHDGQATRTRDQRHDGVARDDRPRRSNDGVLVRDRTDRGGNPSTTALTDKKKQSEEKPGIVRWRYSEPHHNPENRMSR